MTHDLIEPSLKVIKAMHDFKVPSLLVVLSHYNPLKERQNKIFDEIQKIKDEQDAIDKALTKEEDV